MRIICAIIGHRWEAIWTPIGVRWYCTRCRATR